MSKLHFLSFGLVALSLFSCSDDSGEPDYTSKFEAEFTELTPAMVDGNTFNPEEFVKTLITDVKVPFTEASKDTVREYLLYVESETKYSLTISSTTAILEIASSTAEKGEKFACSEITYKLETGTYLISQSGSGSMSSCTYAIITNDEVRTITLYNTDRLPGQEDMAMSFPLFALDGDASYTVVEKKESLGEFLVSSDSSKETQKLRVYTEMNGNMSMTDGVNSYSFTPSSGLLIQTEPDFKEIGKLTRL